MVSGAIQLESCPVGYVVNYGTSAQDQECTAWTALVYVEVQASVFVPKDLFTAPKQWKFKLALAAMSRVSSDQVMITRLSDTRRSTEQLSVDITSRLLTANFTTGTDMIARIKIQNFSMFLSLEGLPKGVLGLISHKDQRSEGNTQISLPIIISICAGVLIFVLIFACAGYLICLVLRKDVAKKGLVTAFQS